MKRLAVVLAALALLVFPAVASADSGNFTSSDGLMCSWMGSGSMYVVSCSGYLIGYGYVSYSCTYTFWSSYSYSYSCRDMNGNTWRGSR